MPNLHMVNAMSLTLWLTEPSWHKLKILKVLVQTNHTQFFCHWKRKTNPCCDPMQQLLKGAQTNITIGGEPQNETHDCRVMFGHASSQWIWLNDRLKNTKNSCTNRHPHWDVEMDEIGKAWRILLGVQQRKGQTQTLPQRHSLLLLKTY